MKIRYRMPFAIAPFAIAPFAIAAVAGLAHAADKPEDAAARQALHDLVPQAKIDTVEAAPLPGYRQVIVGSQLVYVSDDGKYMLQGTLYDSQNKRDLTGSRLAVDHKRKVDAVPLSKRIVFAPDKPKYKITVFTDLDCGYCRKLHSQIAEYNKRGIEVDYLFFPRTGLNSPSYDKAVSVWCAKDRNTAFTEAKAGKTPTPAKCDNPVADEYKLGAQVGVDGTPTIFAPDGTKIGGYLSPTEMLAKLENLGKATLAGN
jgi:thiol:disulfide interchange protein DsbC